MEGNGCGVSRGWGGGRAAGEGRQGAKLGVAVCLLCHTRCGTLPCPSLRSHGEWGGGLGAEVRGPEGPSLSRGMESDCLLQSAEARVRGQRLVKSRMGRSAAEA